MFAVYMANVLGAVTGDPSLVAHELMRQLVFS
jgi:hypothetical protein